MLPPLDVVGSRKSERKYQVFISSTFGDLSEQRRMVLDAVIDRGHIPVALERFPAADSGVSHIIQKTIEASQIYIVILGFRYGAMANSEVSFTHLEYQNALNHPRVVVIPFLLSEGEVHQGRSALQDQLDADNARLSKLAVGTPEHNKLKQEIAHLKAELGHDKKLWEFRAVVSNNRFCRHFSKDGGSFERFDKHMVLAALLEAEQSAEDRRIPGWIREPEERELAEAVEAVSQNHFFVDVVRAMAKFNPLAPRVRSQKDQKEAAAMFFVEKYLFSLQEKGVNLFVESGSTLAYVADAVGQGLRDKESGKELVITTNNVLAYLIFWLVHGIRCSLFPWGPPEKQYGAVFGRINDLVPERRTPSFPPEELGPRDRDAINYLLNEHFSPAKWTRPSLLLGALSELQLEKNRCAFDCLGPHVGSPRNKIFKRFMYAANHPLMLFLTATKIDCPVKVEHCHFILEQESNAGAPTDEHFLEWATFCRERPVAFCVGCDIGQGPTTAKKFEDLGFKIARAEHKTPTTAFIARNQRFIDELEQGMTIG